MTTPQSRTLNLGDGRPSIEVLEAGEGAPLLFLHGAGGIVAWEGVLPLLSSEYHVYAPLLPGFVVVAIWQFTSIWNDFLFAVTVTSNPNVQPVTVALNNLAGSYIVEWNVQMAGALLAAIPTLIVYIVLGRYFVQGLMAGALR